MHLLSSRLVLLLSIALGSAACASSSIGEGDDGAGETPDGGVLPGDPDADPGAPDADPGAPDAEPELQTTTIQQATSNDITAANSINCGNGTAHAENHYFRVYDMPTEGIDEDFRVTRVDIGIETAAATAGSQPISVKIHTVQGLFAGQENPNLTELASVDTNVSDQTQSIISIPFDTTVPAGSVFVVEVATPDGVEAGNQFFIGSNQAGETQPGYIMAPSCGVNAPTSFSQLSQDNIQHPAHMVMTVTGEHF